jgi:DNA polymerase-3 subunit delta
VAAETALAFLRSLRSGPLSAAVVVIAGPQPFLREYTFDQLRVRLAGEGFKYRSFQLGAGTGVEPVINELESADLFAPRRMVVCRLLRAYRDRGGADAEDDGDGSATGSSAGGEAALVAAIGRLGANVRLAIVCERDTAPAKVRRAAEQHGIVVNCLRPFDNQLSQYVELFARNAGLKLSAAASDRLLTRHGSDLSAIANALNRAAITALAGTALDVEDFAEGGAGRVPDLFELAEAIARGNPNETLALLARALQVGRDPIEMLAVEIIPLVRRMLVAASLLASRQGAPAIASALGLPPSSTMLARAVDGARNFGMVRLRAAHYRACELDERFKMGLIKERQSAVAGMLLDLMAR